MATTAPESPAGLLCSEWTFAQGLDPVGTAGDYAGYLLVEWPLPWPRDAGEIEELAPLRPTLRATGHRLQLMAAPPGAGTRRVTRYGREAGEAFRGFAAETVRVGADEVVAAAVELLGKDPGTPADAGSPAPEHLVLVCSHGRRDRCCGSRGTQLAQTLQADPGILGAGTALARTSHTGGHRYAPTALVFPEGTAWAFADAELLARVVGRRGRWRTCSLVTGAARGSGGPPFRRSNGRSWPRSAGSCGISPAPARSSAVGGCASMWRDGRPVGTKPPGRPRWTRAAPCRCPPAAAPPTCRWPPRSSSPCATSHGSADPRAPAPGDRAVG